MVSVPQPTGPAGPAESRAFVRKAARSIAELQPRLNGVADVMVFLEVLGYTVQDARRNGFADLRSLSQEIHEFIDIFEPEESPKSKEAYLDIPSVGRRVAEGLALSFGWLGSLVILFAAGVSLWLSFKLPLQVTTVFIAGIFSGLILTEGPLQAFNKLFSFYHDQGNLSEAKRVLGRAYFEVTLIVGLALSALYLAAVEIGFPLYLFELGVASLVTVAAFRMVYAIIYSLRKVGHLLASYTLAFAVLLYVYFELGYLIPDAVTRYFYALIAALVVLSTFALYDQFQVLRGTSFKTRGYIPHFWRKVNINRSTIASRFSVQFWETFPSFLFGGFFFILLFGDRFLSWFFNPVKVAGGIHLPFVFNYVYHTGADPALLVIFPALIIQYAIMSPIFAQVTNLTLEYTVEETGRIQSFLVSKYVQLLAASIFSAIAAAVAINYAVPMLIPPTELTATSLKIMRIASVANVLLAVFLANSAFLQLMNKMMGLALILVVGAGVVIIGGLLLASTGFQNIEIAYFAACSLVAAFSTGYVAANLDSAGSLFFSRYM